MLEIGYMINPNVNSSSVLFLNFIFDEDTKKREELSNDARFQLEALT